MRISRIDPEALYEFLKPKVMSFLDISVKADLTADQDQRIKHAALVIAGLRDAFINTMSSITTPERGSGTNVGKVVIDGEAYEPQALLDFAELITQAATDALAQRTQVSSIPDDQHVTRLDSIVLKHNPGEYDGSFSGLMFTFLEDQLRDAPIEVEIIYFDDEQRQRKQLVGLVTAVNASDRETLTFEDGFTLSLFDLEVYEFGA